MKHPSILNRCQEFIAIGALPSSTIAAICDFFVNKHGNIVIIFLGLISAIIAFILYIIIKRSHRLNKDSLLLEKITGNDVIYWDYEKPIKSHGIHLVIIFSIVCFVFGYYSTKNVATGGVLGSNIEFVQQLREQTMDLQEIKTILTQVKKETSDDPVKEIANRGRMWNANSFNDAIREGDIKAVELYLQGGMIFNSSTYTLTLKAKDPKLQQILLAGMPSTESTSICRSMTSDTLRPIPFDLRETTSHSLDSIKAYVSDFHLDALRKACSHNVAYRQAILEDLRKEEKSFQEQQQLVAQVQAYKISESACLKKYLGKGEVALWQRVRENHKTSYEGFNFEISLYQGLMRSVSEHRHTFQWANDETTARLIRDYVEESCKRIANIQIKEGEAPGRGILGGGIMHVTQPELMWINHINVDEIYYQGTDLKIKKNQLIEKYVLS